MTDAPAVLYGAFPQTGKRCWSVRRSEPRIDVGEGSWTGKKAVRGFAQPHGNGYKTTEKFHYKRANEARDRLQLLPTLA